jgi:hypothetical protein
MSKIAFDCPECGHTNHAPAAAAGRKGKCAGCKAVVRVPKEEPDEDDPELQLAPKKAPKKAPKASGSGITFTCEYCAETISAPKSMAGSLFMCRECGERTLVPGRDGKPGGVRDLKHEGHLRAMASWYRIGGLLMIVAAVLMFFGVMMSGGRGKAMGMVVVVVYAGLGTIPLFLGTALWNYKNWARLVCLGFQVLGICLNLLGLLMNFGLPSLLGFMISTGISAAYIWALAAAPAVRICSPAYQRLINHDRHGVVRWYASPFFWVPAGLIGCGLLLLVFAVVMR